MHIDWQLPRAALKPLLALAAAVLAGAAVWWWMSAPVAETSVATTQLQALPSATAQSADVGSVVVDVVGAVEHPGVVRVAAGSRVVDAVAAAGGVLPRHVPGINMARLVIDGEQLVIGGASGSAAESGPTTGGSINMNAASAAELDGLPGIGPVLAQRIVDFRSQHGPFAHVRDLLEVPGIGDSKFSQLSGLVSVG